MNRRLVALTVAGALAGLGAWRAEACTSMIFKAEDGTRIYARTMEWGASDLKSEMMLAPRGLAFSSEPRRQQERRGVERALRFRRRQR